MSCIFADWNGVQNIIAPSVMVFLFDEYTLINWFTGVFSYHRYYIPVMVYLLFLSAIVFFGTKALFAWEAVADAKQLTNENQRFFKAYFIPYMLHMHKWLLIYLTSFMLVYVIKEFVGIVYAGSFPFVAIIFFILRYGFAAAFFYNYILIDLTIPIVKRGHSFHTALRYMRALITVRTKGFLLAVAIQLVWVYASILALKLLINLLDDTLIILGLSNASKGLLFSFFAVSNLYHFIINVMILLTAFLVLNLIYYPLIVLLRLGLKRVKLTLRDI